MNHEIYSAEFAREKQKNDRVAGIIVAVLAAPFVIGILVFTAMALVNLASS